ncbi:MAG: cysteine desulfurase family protein [Sandaracinaceae bacterium]
MAEARRIYLDHHAMAPLVPAAAEAIARARRDAWANPASPHAPGRVARRYLEEARAQVAEAVGAEPADIVLTGGGTEACNLAVLGLGAGARRIVTTAVEHPAVAAAVARLERAGATVEALPCPAGVPPGAQALEAAAEGADLVAVQWVNHETGTVFPVAAYGAVCRRLGVPLVVDGTQALGKVEVEVGRSGAAAVAFASTKIGGPAGAGALWVARARTALSAQLLGGAQERGRRAGTPDVAALAGFGAACDEVPSRLAAQPAIADRRDAVAAALRSAGAAVNATAGPRVATVAHASVRGARGPVLVAALDLEGIAASSGAACSSGLDEPSPVLRAMYPDEPWRAEGALRLSLGPSTTDEDIERAGAALARVLARAARRVGRRA